MPRHWEMKDSGPATVFFTNGLGDYVMTVPALRALGRIFGGQLTLLTGMDPTDILLADVNLARTVKMPMRVCQDGGRLFDAEEAAARLRPTRWLISLAPWQSEAMTRLISNMKPALSIGMHDEFDYVVPARSRHAADRAFDIVRCFEPGARLEEFVAPLPLPSWSAEIAAGVRRELRGRRRLLVVHAETPTAEKRWPATRMEQALKTITRQCPEMFVLAICHRDPGFNVEAIGDAGLAVRNMPLGLFLALISAADVFMGVDSFGLHAADLCGVPGVGLFGLTDPSEYGFRFSRHHRHLDGGGYMSNIGVEEVVEAVMGIAEARRATSSELGSMRG